MKTGATFNGKPVYCKAFGEYLDNSTTWLGLNIYCPDYNIETIIKVDSSIKQTSGNKGIGTWYSSSTDYHRVVYTENDKKLHICFGSAFTTSDYITAIIYYTKTTD